MESNQSLGKYPSRDGSRRSMKQRSSKLSSKVARDSKISKIMDIKEEQVESEVPTTHNYRQCITELFFESFFSTLVVETKPVKIHNQASPSTTSLNNPLSSDSAEESYISVLESASSKAGSSLSKDMSFHKPVIPSTQSMAESTSTNVSCSSNCTCCWKVMFRNGNIYEGTLNGNLMEGKGAFYWSDGAIYKGEFKHGYPWGQGKMILTDLSTYEGAFCMGFFHGKGLISIKSTPTLYSGEWRVSKRNGKGWLLYEPNNWYEGDFVENKKHGYGKRQYINGDTYVGSWQNDLISGNGSMIWHNNDYYTGGWSNGRQHGYGEYTWNLVAHNSFVFPNYNWYKGNWVDGLRTGAGIMNFGHESGSKLAGTWLENRKDGPGVMICGNGMTIERNPLFTDDKPATFLKDKHTPSAKGDSSTDSSSEKKENALKSFLSIYKHINSKENLETLNIESLMNIHDSSANIQMKQFVKLLEPQVTNTPPLKIPIHNNIHEIDWDYFIQDFFRPKLLGKNTTDVSIMEIEHMFRTQEGSMASPSCMNYLSSNADFSSHMTATASQYCLPNTNELKNLIINYLPQLRDVYKKYASMCFEQESLSFEPVLIRLFLWQLYRDIRITDQGGISIIEVDEMLFKNPNSCLETLHSPWEPIYFWQFLQALVGVACMMFTIENHLDYTPSSGFIYYMFKNFLDEKLFIRAGNYEGNCLTNLKDLIPTEDVYELYKDTGEPHTVKEFLRSIFLPKGHSINCYKFINNDENSHEFTVPIGRNIVVLNKELSYSEDSQIKVKLENNNKQQLYEGLYSFSCLSRKKIISSLCKICPQLILASGKYNLSYRLSFIEFYEALLLLAFEKADLKRLHKQNAAEESKGMSVIELKSINREITKSTTSTKGKKKKK